MAKKRQLPDARIYGVNIIFRNLMGLERKFNAAGKRNFSIALSPEQAAALKADGWNVKERHPKDPDDDRGVLLHMKANVNYKSAQPPAIWLVTSRGRTLLDETTVGMIDVAEISNVDVTLSAYFFDEETEVPSAYVKSMYVTIVEDEMERKYAELEDKGGNAPEPTPPWEE